MPGAEPFTSDPGGAAGSGGSVAGREIGVVLCHGFTGTPQSMRPWGEHLAAEGFGVRAPRLPGHGTRWQDMNATRWPDWYGAVARAVDELAGSYRSVFVFGLSMGGTLTLRLAEEYGDAIAGIALVNPSVTTLRRDAAMARHLRWVLPSVAGIGSDVKKPGVTELAYPRTPVRAFVSLTELWSVVRADLARVRCPLVLFRSPADHVVEPVNAQLVLDGVSSTDVTDVELPDSYHVATLDNDAPTIFADSVAFARRVHRSRTSPAGSSDSGLPAMATRPPVPSSTPSSVPETATRTSAGNPA